MWPCRPLALHTAHHWTPLVARIFRSSGIIFLRTLQARILRSYDIILRTPQARIFRSYDIIFLRTLQARIFRSYDIILRTLQARIFRSYDIILLGHRHRSRFNRLQRHVRRPKRWL